jgi:hypothetical protein
MLVSLQQCFGNVLTAVAAGLVHSLASAMSSSWYFELTPTRAIFSMELLEMFTAVVSGKIFWRTNWLLFDEI